MNKEEMSIAMEKIFDVSNRLAANQNRAIKRLSEQTDKKLEAKINDACKRLSDKTIKEIKDRLEIVNNIEKITSDVRDLKRITEDLIDRHTILTEVSYIARQRLDAVGQARVNAELIKSMDFSADWFKKRNDLSLNKLFEIYHNGVDPDPTLEE